jgi:uncharacterized protein
VQINDKATVLAATDLSNFLACRHRSALDLAVAMGQLQPPAALLDVALKRLWEKGAAHERAYVEYLCGLGLSIVEISGDGAADERVSQTIAALKSGADVICQGAFAGQGWMGYADVLRKEPCPPGMRSTLGDFYYEPYDTKLARETRGGTILQLALYADLLGDIQGVMPERFFVVTPGKDNFNVQAYRLADYAAYFRMVRARMLAVLGKGPEVLLGETYPDPVEHCDICRWWERCNKRRRDDDHLSFIAGVGLSQRTELVSHGVKTLAAAAAMPVPVTFKPSRGTTDTYNRIAEQARVQLEQRTKKEPVFKLLPVVPAQGLCRLPEPSPGDLFLDLEGARFVREGGHEYLFGLGHLSASGGFEYRCWWAMDAAEEQAAFEALIDATMQARMVDPDLHIYHFAPYEPTALKRLAGRYATRQDPLDELLRGECFVDLYAAVRQAVRAGVESYSIKELEQYFGYTRAIPLRDATTHRIAIEIALESGDPGAIQEETRVIVEQYNRDDVVSTWRLREWLEGLRTRQIEEGVDVPRPMAKQAEQKDPGERTARAEALRAQLLDGVSPEAATTPDHPHHPRWLLAFLIDWHHREEKANWWEYFRLQRLPEEDLLDEPKAITGLQHVIEVGPFLSKKGKPTGSTIHRYRFPLQEVEFTEGDKLKRLDGQAFGEVLKLDRTTFNIEVKRGPKSGKDHVGSVFSNDVIGTESVQMSVMRFATTLHGAGYAQPSAGADLLYRRPPRLRTGDFNPRPNESITDFAVRIITELDRTTLAIQGPPGAGKTYVGARMIRAAMAAGLRVGVTANSHKVIQNLLDEIRKQGRIERKELRLGHKTDDEANLADGVRPFKDNESAIAAITGREIDVLGGTAWLWADEQATQSVDVLFVDEAGQFSLANTLAVSLAAMSVVVLGDPQQLDQPQKASHPEGVGISALAHVLGSSETMPSDRGIFMPETWRLAPAVCSYTSELFYAGKLKPLPSLADQQLAGTEVFDGAGLWWIPVPHDGNRSSSDEEVKAVAELVDRLIRAKWVDQAGKTCPLTAADLRVVAPYNAQVNRLATRLQPLGVPVGTVDKFQGQTCAAVIYSMATSSPEDAPRGMEFLYSLNRLNVATSRGRCATFIVASPALLEPQCRTPRQMQLANGLCRFVEMAMRR